VNRLFLFRVFYTGLDALLAELVRVVQETMQPKVVSVWLVNPSGFADSQGGSS
jgi:hypothetical protein